LPLGAVLSILRWCAACRHLWCVWVG
jgi:hypothetical protein